MTRAALLADLAHRFATISEPSGLSRRRFLRFALEQLPPRGRIACRLREEIKRELELETCP